LRYPFYWSLILQNLNIHAGPYAYLISGKTTNKSDSGSYNFEDNVDVDDFNRFDAGLAGGVGLDLESVSFGYVIIWSYQKVKTTLIVILPHQMLKQRLECICFLCTLSVSLQTSLH
jgi:hypothetical protein